MFLKHETFHITFKPRADQ